MGRSRLAESLTALRDAMAHPPLRRAEVAYGLAWMGESAFTVALGVVTFRDGGAAAVGLVALLRTLPSALVSSSLASVADRVSRERVLAGVSAVQAVAYAASALLLALEARLAGVYALAVVATIAGTLFRPTHSALLPSLCESVPQLTSATVARGALDALGVMLGPRPGRCPAGGGRRRRDLRGGGRHRRCGRRRAARDPLRASDTGARRPAPVVA